jgi:hypothetical protein
MMYKFLLFTLFFGVANILFGQSSNFVYSKIIDKEASETLNFVFQNENQWYMIKKSETDKSSFSVDILDSNLNIVAKNKLKLGFDELIKVGFVNKNLVFFGSHHNAQTLENQIKGFVISSRLEVAKELSFLELKSNGGYHPQFDVSVAPNGKYFSMIGSEAYQIKGKEVIQTTLYDENFVQVFSVPMYTSQESSKRRFNVLVCNDEGYSYMLKKDRQNNQFSYFMYGFDAAGNSSNFPINLKSRQIADMTYDLMPSGALLVGGFFSSPLTLNFEGTFIVKYENNTKSSFQKEYFLNENIVSTFKSKKEIKDNGFGLDYFRIGKLKYIDEKNIILTAEHHTTIKDSKSGNMDYRKGIVVTNFDENGGFKFSTPIVTEQSDSESKGYWSSHQFYGIKNQLYLMLNKLSAGSKSVKNSQANATFPVEENIIDGAGSVVSNYPEINISAQNIGLNTTLENKSNVPVICFESKDRKSYTFGVLKIEHEE